MLRFGFFLFVILMLRSSCYASDDDIQGDDESEITINSHEVVDSFPRTYDAAQYPWRLWNFPFYQPRAPQMPGGDGGGSPPLADPRFVTNRCNSRQTYTPTTTTFYTCFTTIYTTATYISTTTVTTTMYPTTTPPPETTTPTTTATTSTDSTTTGYTSTTTPPLAVECGRSKFTSSARILGGTEATPHQFPWMVHFLLQNTTSGEFFECGGTLISDRHVITAPHCFYELDPLRFGVQVLNISLGAHNLVITNSSDDQVRQYADWLSMTFAGNFSNPIDNCINVVTLRKPLIMNDYVVPACLPYELDSDQVNDTVVLTGWGANNSTGEARLLLQKTVTTVVSSDQTNGQCQYGPGTFSSDTLICSDGSQQRRYCKYDDGGPMNFYHKECDRWFVVGVAGRGDSYADCLSSNKPNVYTRVRNQLGFIRSATNFITSPVDCQQTSDAGTLLNVAISEQMTIVSTVKQPDDTTITTMTKPNQIKL